MRFTVKLRSVLALAASTIAVGIISVGAPVSAAPPISVDFTVHEILPLTAPGDLTSSDVPGCAPGVGQVATFVTVTTAGPQTRFTGTKVFDCGGGNTFTLQFRAATSGCSPSDSGRWKLIDGAGIFAGAKGQGSLVGTYTLGAGAGTACDSDGIDDHYVGKIKLAP